MLIASGKTGDNKYENDSLTKAVPDLDMKILGANLQKLGEVTKGYSISGDEGASEAINEDLSIIDDTNYNSTYKSELVQQLNTLIGFSNTLAVDGTSTANAIVLVPKKISSDLAPDGEDYTITNPLPLKYQDGIEFTFEAIADNTDTVTISIPALSGLSGAIDLLDERGNALAKGELYIGKIVKIKLKTISSVKKAILLNDLPKTYANSPSYRNKIINGSFDIWQRGTSFSSIATATYTADRWEYSKSGTMVHDISRSTDVPTVAQAGRLFNYSIKIDCTTVDSSIGSSDICYLAQKIEGYNFLPLAQKVMTASFWVKATKIGTYCVAVGNDVDRFFVSEITVNASNTWEYKTIRIAASPSGGTWNYTNGIGLKLYFILAAGSNFQTTKDAWQTGVYCSTSNQVNACDSTSNDFYLCGVQLEEGNVATPFESQSISEILNQCKRYYRKSYNLDINPATATATGALSFLTGLNSCCGMYSFGNGMRGTPTIRYWDLAGNLSKINANGVNNTVIGSGGIGAEENHLYIDIAPTVAADKTVKFQFDANAEL